MASLSCDIGDFRNMLEMIDAYGPPTYPDLRLSIRQSSSVSIHPSIHSQCFDQFMLLSVRPSVPSSLPLPPLIDSSLLASPTCQFVHLSIRPSVRNSIHSFIALFIPTSTLPVLPPHSLHSFFHPPAAYGSSSSCVCIFIQNPLEALTDAQQTRTITTARYDRETPAQEEEKMNI